MARRMQDEGHKVAMYFAKDTISAGDGIVPKLTSVAQLSSWVGSDGLIICDGSLDGDVADRLRANGHFVFGGGSFAERLEARRAYAEALAAQCGLSTPPSHPFATIADALGFVKKHPEKTFFFKPNKRLDCSATASAKTHTGFVRQLEFVRERFGNNISCILQEEIEGVALSTMFAWNGHTIVWPLEGTLEHKKFMAQDIGPATGCSVNAVWFYNTMPDIARMLHLDKVEQCFRKEGAPAGFYDINAIVNESGAYFLEWTPRFGYDSEPTAQLLYHGDYAETLFRLASGTIDELPVYTMDVASAYGVRVTVPPYSWEHEKATRGKSSIVGTPVEFGVKNPRLWRQFIGYCLMKDATGYRISDPSGLLGLIAVTGTNLEKMEKEMEALIDRLDVKDLQWRPDGPTVLAKDLKNMKKYGLEAPDLA